MKQKAVGNTDYAAHENQENDVCDPAGLGLARSSKNPTPENVKKTAYKNCNRAPHGILSKFFPSL